jgi:excinuclease ABC subunit C
MRVRDEAHRFAITYHRKLREEALTHSRLLDIPGIGPSREKQLLLTFGSVEELKSAGPERIAREGGLPASLARRIAEHLSGGASPGTPKEDDR